MKPTIERPDERSIVIAQTNHRFAQRIKDVIVANDKVVIRLVSSDFADGDPEAGRNVIAYDSDGDLIWRVEDSGFVTKRKSGTTMPQGYTGLRFVGDVLIAFQPIGCRCTIDMETGKITAEKQTK